MKLRIGFVLLGLGVASAVYLFFATLGLWLELEKGGNPSDELVRIGLVSAGMVLLLVLGVRMTRELREAEEPSDKKTDVTVNEPARGKSESPSNPG